MLRELRQLACASRHVVSASRWSAYKVDANGDGDYTDAGDLDQSRTHNAVNELTGLSEAGGQSAWADPVHDARGNMTSVPKPADMTGTYTCVYDAWNRLVKVSDGQTTVAEYRYDGLGRRIRKYVPDGENWTVTEYYYSAGWQVLEVRRDGGIARSGSPLSEPALATTLCEQYVWSPRYIDSPILRDRDNAAGGDLGKSASGLDERLYYLTDAQMNITALVATGGDAVERYTYDPYGKVTIYDGTWTNTRSSSSYANEVLYSGYRLDTETGLYQVRNRVYHPLLGRWIQRDPLPHMNGTNLYEYVAANPLLSVDPYGLKGESTAKWIKDRVLTPLSYAVPGSEFTTAAEALPDLAIVMIGAELKNRQLEVLYAGGEPEQDPQCLALKAVLHGVQVLTDEQKDIIRKHYGIRPPIKLPPPASQPTSPGGETTTKPKPVKAPGPATGPATSPTTRPATRPATGPATSPATGPSPAGTTTGVPGPTSGPLQTATAPITPVTTPTTTPQPAYPSKGTPQGSSAVGPDGTVYILKHDGKGGTYWDIQKP
jgi:RHS repeat-associated protein